MAQLCSWEKDEAGSPPVKLGIRAHELSPKMKPSSLVRLYPSYSQAGQKINQAPAC